MIYIDQNKEEYNNDFRSMLQAYYHNEKIVAASVDADGQGLTGQKGERAKRQEQQQGLLVPRFVLVARFGADTLLLKILEPVQPVQDGQVRYRECKRHQIACDYTDRRAWQNAIHEAIYELMVSYTGRTLPWGFLTGVRPTKIALEMLEAGATETQVRQHFEQVCHTTAQKADICLEVAKKEQTLLEDIRFADAYCLYVGIPFCPSRCLYCSFTSYPIAAYADRVDRYLDALEREMQFGADVYKDKLLTSVYVGGGTPTSISAGQLDRLLGMIETYFDLSTVKEITVEAGRPDSITEEKLAVLAQHGIGRISINPQTMHDETLALIGRAHTVAQTVETFRMARALGFTNINMDIIVGLPGEDVTKVEQTLAAIRALHPDSLTVHSLAIKRAAHLNERLSEYRQMLAGSTDAMLLAVDTSARAMQMEPYYLYRQKNIPGNMENIGYCKPQQECLYNILIMEEKMDILALGAGASTKKVFHGQNRIERAENVKYVDDYMLRIDEMIERKKKLFGV